LGVNFIGRLLFGDISTMLMLPTLCAESFNVASSTCELCAAKADLRRKLAQFGE
jgi:hypothetical protein